MLSEVLKDFVMRFVQGDRCMTARNEKHHTQIPLSDFDAVSLYPSAMRRLWTVQGTPRDFPSEHLNLEFLFTHSYQENQTQSNRIRYIGTYIASI